MKYLIFSFALIAQFSFAAEKLLDKVAGVINDQVYTLSEIKRVQETLPARNEISGIIYKKTDYSDKEILKILQHRFIIKDKLAELGLVISDDSVESRIKETEQRLGLRRQDLLNFLETKNITFNEYFELIREAMEYNYFNSRIIAPLVNITDQEVKNYYYNENSKNEALSFNYEIVDFSIEESKITRPEAEKLPIVLEEYQKTGSLPEVYRDISTNDLGKLRGDDLPKDLSSMLKNTDEGAFSKLYKRDGLVHVFYVKAKDLTESQKFLKKKDQIFNELFMQRSSSIIQNWFSRESSNYYILENL